MAVLVREASPGVRKPGISLLSLFRTLIFQKCFPVIFLREFVQNSCGTEASQWGIGSKSAGIPKYPVNFPVSWESPAETGSYLTAHTTKFFKHLA
jgi:hypothetical protein